MSLSLLRFEWLSFCLGFGVGGLFALGVLLGVLRSRR